MRCCRARADRGVCFLPVSSIIARAPRCSIAPRARLPSAGGLRRMNCLSFSPTAALTAASIAETASPCALLERVMMLLPTAFLSIRRKPKLSWRSSSHSGLCRTTSCQISVAPLPRGASFLPARGKLRLRSAWASSTLGMRRVPARRAGGLARGRTMSLPRRMGQCRIASAAYAPAGSLPWIPATTITVGPAAPLSRTW